MKDEDVYPFDENGQLVITNTAIDKQAPNVSVKGEGNGDRFRKITGIAVHDTEGVKELKVNNTITVINEQIQISHRYRKTRCKRRRKHSSCNRQCRQCEIRDILL